MFALLLRITTAPFNVEYSPIGTGYQLIVLKGDRGGLILLKADRTGLIVLKGGGQPLVLVTGHRARLEQ